jgi:hypothetical protein
MEQCIKCGKEFKTKDLFLQWYTSGEAYICKNCIKRYKQYSIEPCYAADSDITFIFAIARVQITKHNYIELSQTLIGYHYGSPDNSIISDSKEYEQRMLEDWLTKDEKVRKDLIRQSFNENQKDEEVLY